MRLSKESLGKLPASISRFDYDRDAKKIGIIHFGLGAFSRAHLSVFTDAAMAHSGGDWMIMGVSMRSDTVAQQLNPQNGYYCIAQQSETGTDYHLGQAISHIVTAPNDPEIIAKQIADDAVQILSFTITEKGYCRASDGMLDMDIAGQSIYPLIADGMKRRMKKGGGGLTLLSCDNLSENGLLLKNLMQQYLTHHDAELLNWFNNHCTCPSTMVDRIVPATTESDRIIELDGTLLRDEGVVITEAFNQWVIEDDFAGQRPDWDKAGAQIVDDVAPYEMAKLRMLNGAHSLLAYCGLRAGYEFVHEAAADPALRAMALRLMHDAIPSIAGVQGMDLPAYAEQLIARFDNPALHHRLAQIAMDGSQKLPQRWLHTLAYHDEQCPAILEGIAAWILYLRKHGVNADDPMAEALAPLAMGDDCVETLFAKHGILSSSWEPTADDIDFILTNITR